ncbi:MAG: hypothetical protein ACRD2U_11020 [Terriglobales bacterium]
MMQSAMGQRSHELSIFISTILCGIAFGVPPDPGRVPVQAELLRTISYCLEKLGLFLAAVALAQSKLDTDPAIPFLPADFLTSLPSSVSISKTKLRPPQRNICSKLWAQAWPGH